MATESEVIAVIKKVLQHANRPAEAVELASPLYGNGLGIDSLAAAELSTALEKSFGKDPYVSGRAPQTVQDIVDFYSAT